MWLKLKYINSKSELFDRAPISVIMCDSLTVPIDFNDEFVRLSKIFPLVENNTTPQNIVNGELHFFDYQKPYKVLGEIYIKGSKELRDKIYFSTGSSSIILISDDNNLTKEFFAFSFPGFNDHEMWSLKNGEICNIDFGDMATKHHQMTPITIKDYSKLPLVIRSILDESVASIFILRGKEFDSQEVEVISFFIKTINDAISELNYLNNFMNEKPETLFADDNMVKNPLLNSHLQNQIIDRLIQINSSLSYVSTQSYSGTIPILERRSIIRRCCLLGIGSSIRALNRIVRYIEQSFYSINFYIIITDLMHISAPLCGLEERIYSKKDWYKHNIDEISLKHKGEASEIMYKLAYFSSRNAFRESEYAITASMNCITSGLSLSWTLMTITHEMLHSHIRQLMAAIFYEKDNNSYKIIFEKFENKYKRSFSEDYFLIDSLREIVLRYCIGTKTYGSITNLKEYKTKSNPEYNITTTQLMNIFEEENRNINEILAHTLDLNYFYKGNTTYYILLIWSSWASLPNVKVDIRQYILRSLLAIASTIDQDFYDRFMLSIKIFKDILTKNRNKLINNPLSKELILILNDDELLMKDYFGAFKNSIILVDLAMELLFSKKVTINLWNDESVITENVDGEDLFTYDIPLDFINSEIQCPIPYLFDRMIKVLNGEIKNENIERETAISFLAMN